MKIHFTSYIILVLLAFTLGSCNIMDDSPCTDEPASVGTPVQVGFTLTTGEVSSRAIEEGDVPGTGYENYIDVEGKDFRILLFNATNDTYLTTFEPTIIRATDNSQYPQTYYVEGELPEAYSNFKLVVLANWGKDAYPTNLQEGVTTIDKVCTSTYTYNAANNTSIIPSAENKIPMYGVKTCTETLRADLLTDLGTVDLLRAMAKIEVKCSESLEDITLTGVTLHHYNTSGMCAPKGIYGNTTDWDADTGTDCSHEIHLPENVTQGESLLFNKVGESYIAYVPEFDNKTTGVTKSYISVSMEHADGSPVNLENTDIYFGEYNNEGTLIENTDFDIVRNHWYTYTINNVDDGKLIFQYRVKKWNVEASQIGWNVDFLLTAWNGQEFDATKGDAEGYFCIVCNPKYNEADIKHRTLAKGSSGAAFEFTLTKPEGAIWKAHLDNSLFKFAESTYTDDEGVVRKCASTGRARPEPYQIKIEALQPWTEDINNDGQIDDDEYTEFGKENNGKEVKTQFWISVSLDDEEGHDYILIINPEKVINDGNKTYYQDGHRFAGTNTHITIWQLNALQNDKQDEDLGYGYDELIEDYIENGLNHKWWKGIPKDDSN